MTRQANGTWLPTAGNPVVTGTTITSTWANALVPDIGSDLADSLSRSGKGGMLAPLKIEDGTIGAPALTFSAEPTTGLYRAAAGDARFAVLGVDNLRIKTGVPPAYWNGAAWGDLVAANANNTFTGTNTFNIGGITLGSNAGITLTGAGNTLIMGAGSAIIANGATISDTEVSYLDGLTANVQSSKANLNAPIFTGNMELPTSAKTTGGGGIMWLVDTANVGGAVTTSVAAASGAAAEGDIWMQYI